MASPSASGQFQPGIDILGTSVSPTTKKILAQTGSNVGEGQTDCDNVQWVQHVGLASRPANPEKGKAAAQAFVIRQGGQDVALGSYDLRGLDIYGNLQPGETCIFAVGADGTAQARILLKADGSINLFTKEGNDVDGAGMGIFVNADGSISLASHNGAAVLVGTDGSIKIFNGSGSVQVLADGSIKLASGAKVEISGASITMGGLGALPLAIGPQVVAAITALQTEIAALSSALAGVPATAAVAAAFATALTTGAATISSATPLIPTKRVSGD